MSKQKDWPRSVRPPGCNVTVKVYRRKTPAGNYSFMVCYKGPTGKLVFESKPDEAQAMEHAKFQAETLSTFGAKVAATAPELIADWTRQDDRLKPFGVTVTQGVDRLLGWLETYRTLDGIAQALVSAPGKADQIISKTVADAVTEILAHKETQGMSQAYIYDMKCRLKNSFAKAFVCNVSDVTTALVQQWLDGLKMPGTTYMNVRRILNMFFGFCIARNYCAVNPMKKTEARKSSSEAPQVFTPDEMIKLLAACPVNFKPMMAICGFAGVRAAEFKRMTWANVDFESGHIVLDKKQTKTNRRRIIPMSANLVAWLLPYKGQTGPIWTDGGIPFQQMQAAKKAQVQWKDNGLRHSFCSYRLIQTGDIFRTSLEAGNSPAIIETNYKALVTEAQAAQWYAIMPPQNQN